MGGESLRELLAQVHQRLSASGSVDEEARELLATVMRDIERSLASGAPAASAGRASLPRLESLAVRFEAVHPALAQALREAIDALGKAGI
jgi:predicted component of type VI protein secretion system